MPVKKNPNKLEAMVDLETLGRRPGCAILSIGLVLFSPLELKIVDELYVVVSRKSCKTLGLHEDPETLTWWERQSEGARQVLADAENARKSKGIGRALDMLTEKILPLGKRSVHVWSNGPEFDAAILAHTYHEAKREIPWEFWNNHSLRTIRKMYPQVPKIDFAPGQAHNALEDARNQAQHVMDIYRHVREQLA